MLRAAFLLTGVLAAAAGTVSAADPGWDREGLTIGFRIGVGHVAIEAEGSDATRGAAAGGAGTFRIGYASGAKWLVALSASGWNNESFGVKQTVSLIGMEAAWLPRPGGFWLEGMVGRARARFPGPSDGRAGDVDTSGWGIRLGAGYEWRLTRTFALGPGVDLTRTNLDAAVANWVNVSATFHWYL